jgi:hypothetical protein
VTQKEQRENKKKSNAKMHEEQHQNARRANAKGETFDPAHPLFEFHFPHLPKPIIHKPILQNLWFQLRRRHVPTIWNLDDLKL